MDQATAYEIVDTIYLGLIIVVACFALACFFTKKIK